MDHFPNIEKAGPLSFVVPYIAGQQYDGKVISNILVAVDVTRGFLTTMISPATAYEACMKH